MKRKSVLAASLLLTLLIVACSQAPSEQAAVPDPAPPAPEYLTHYLAVHAALAGDNPEEARSSLTALAAATEGEFSEQAESLAAADDLIAIRQGFAGLSETVISRADLPEGYAVAHCPMAIEEQGARWVQAKGDIANPYFGEEMLYCGTLEKN